MTGRERLLLYQSGELQIRDLAEREEALQQYIQHREGLEDNFLESDDVLTQATFFVRNRVTDGFESWLNLLQIRRAASPLFGNEE